MADVRDLENVKLRLGMCFKIINEYSWLLDSYVLDFFTENHLEILPKSWREHLKHTSLEDFHNLLNLSEKNLNNIWPLSILCVRALIQLLALPRNINRTEEFNLIQANKIDITQMPRTLHSACFKHPKLMNFFLKNVKPKKRYEIFKMAETTASIADKLGIKYVVDVGSGLGHLSRIMSYGFNLNVCSIETQTLLITQAAKLDGELEKTASKYLSVSEFKEVKNKRPTQMNQTIQINLTAEEFVTNLKLAFGADDNNFKFGIIGLHPCGDLASILLRLYINSPEAEFINLVGCCYHKLSISSDSKNDLGFPLARFSTQKYANISYEARALACHAIETYCERLKSSNTDHLKVHCYRAALEKIIDQKWPEYRKSPLGNVKSGPELTFSKYCELALMKLDLKIKKEDLESEDTINSLLKWEDVVKFYSLRLMLAPLVETVILLDRKLFLLENGISCKILVAFDPEISPRNQLLISEKNKFDGR